MRTSIVVLLILSFNSFGLTCEIGGKLNNDITEYDRVIHATDVLMGVVISGSFKAQNSDMKEYRFQLRVDHAFKGNQSGEIDFTYNFGVPPSEITIGESYIVAFYGQNELTHCGYFLRLYDRVTEKSNLYRLAENDNYLSATKLSRFLGYFENAR